MVTVAEPALLVVLISSLVTSLVVLTNALAVAVSTVPDGKAPVATVNVISLFKPG